MAAADDDDDVSAAECGGGGVPGVVAAEAEEERLRPRVGDEAGERSEGDERDPPAEGKPAWNELGRSGSGVESRLMREATLTRCRCWSVGDAAPGGAGGAPRCAGGGGRAISLEGGGRSHVAPFDVFRSMKLIDVSLSMFVFVVDQLLMKATRMKERRREVK